MNNIVIKGRLCHDPELKQTQSGIAVCSFSVAVDRNFTPKGQEKQTDFFNCTIWRGGAEVVSKYFSKGSEIVVSGSMESRKYQDKSGNDRIAWDLQVQNFDFCGGKSESAKPQSRVAQNNNDFEVLEDTGDDLPF